ncbi:exodeoxyribonuclease VII small subunit [Candidatus Puniceispirillum marinum]|uniref:Exodeoxyribonuclease 7 small subunit n=1 Tax=Puniceispirillum marinum (strain IMCC1322) TaxID=488538 RepID=D5BSR3_PUNMI|nr:exodeoxyribonuclease VII small subunit [Candidatus Puniceispirillum marinum]ADE39310.1 exodeoxyribonuclease VII, small subunit [Candidatus Puniceispirillum marinum IMCC1322]
MSQNETKTANFETISFEDALRELETIVTSLERGDVSLDDAIKAFERGTQLKAHCQARLEEARMKVEQIKLPADGAVPTETTPFASGEG